MRYETVLKGLKFRAFHGVYEQERLMGGVFRVDVSVIRTIEQPITTLEQATNYEIIFEVVSSEMKATKELIESVAQGILYRLNNQFPDGQISVTIHKPNPAGLFKSGEASVTFTR
jgi:dihydroneopterin aldolase